MPIHLNRNDKRALIIFAVFIVLFLFFQFVVSPFSEKIKKNSSLLAFTTKEYNEIVKLKNEYKAISGRSSVSGSLLLKRGKNFSLYSFLDKLTEFAGLKNSVEYIKPSIKKDENDNSVKRSIVEMKFQNITIENLLSYLYKVETSKKVVEVVMVSILKTNTKSQFINAVIKFETIES
jgi:hypothetical protein